MSRLPASHLLITLAVLATLVAAAAVAWFVAVHNGGGRDCGQALCARDFTALVTTEDGAGSGVLIDQEHVLTAAHVVAGSTAVSVTFADDQMQHKAVSLAMSSCDDLAVIRIERVPRQPARLSNIEAKAGDDNYVAGFPGEGKYISSSGRVQDTGIEVAYLHDLLQTNARIEPGNSGGPLLSKRGDLIGIVTARITTLDRVALAIDLQAMKAVLPKLLQGESTNAYCQRFGYEDCGWPALHNDQVDFGCSKDGLYVSAFKHDAEARVPAPYDAQVVCTHYVLRTRGVTDGFVALGVVAFTDPSNYLLAAITPGQQYGIYRVAEGKQTALRGFTKSDRIKSTGPNDLTLEVDGARISLSVNNTRVDTVTDASMGKEVRFGLYGRSFAASQEPSTAYFSWVAFECRD